MSNPKQLERMYQPPEWFDHTEARQVHDWYPELRSMLTTYAVAGAIAVAERQELIPDTDLSIIEFGSGLGEGLVSLNMLAESRGGNSSVLGTERNDQDCRVANQVADILGRVSKVEEDGISELELREDQSDIVLAHMFGPIYDGQSEEFLARFMTAAIGSISQYGVVIINSDPETMDNVEMWAQANLETNYFKAVRPSELPVGFTSMPHLLITK